MVNQAKIRQEKSRLNNATNLPGRVFPRVESEQWHKGIPVIDENFKGPRRTKMAVAVV